MIIIYTNYLPYTSAIIGAGIGGASSAHYLRQLFGPKVDIAIYEDVSVGGRLANIKVAGQEFEAGGSMIHDQNMYMVNFTRLLGECRGDEAWPAIVCPST